MDKKNIIIIIIIIIIISLVFVSTIFKQNYRTFSDSGDKCVNYEKDCTCYGSLTTLESYPPQYKCQGLDFCKNINITECN